MMMRDPQLHGQLVTRRILTGTLVAAVETALEVLKADDLMKDARISTLMGILGKAYDQVPAEERKAITFKK